ncbi:MAG: caspase family protein [Bacteroidota bacterium]
MSLSKKINKIISQKENNRLVYKAIPPSPYDLAILIGSLANTNGGMIVLGVVTKSNGVIKVAGLGGFETEPVVKKSLNYITPKIEITTEQISYKEKRLFAIEVSKSRVALLVNSKKYVRVNGNTVLAPVLENYRDAPLRQTANWVKNVGCYQALIIGINDYDYHKKLSRPVQDATILKDILETRYNFNPINLLLDPSRDEILDAFDAMHQQLVKGDNLLIFYAGHGHWEKDINMGYWLPRDAELQSRKNWIENTTIHNYCKRYSKCQHILLIADACFSGTFTENMRSITLENANKAVQELYQLKSRIVMTSGWKEKVPDKSVFFEQVSNCLSDNKEPFLSSLTLFQKIRDQVVINSLNNHKPQKESMLNAGHDGGDFIFINKAEIATQPKDLNFKGDGHYHPLDKRNTLPNTQYIQSLKWTLARVLVDHQQVFGIEKLLIAAKNALLANNTHWIISIFGEGGIGKTTFAFELLKQYGIATGFHRFAWVSAKISKFSSTEQVPINLNNQLKWANLVKDLADQLRLDIGVSKNEWLANFPKALQSLPKGERCLLVIDNLETIEDTEVVDYLMKSEHQVVNPHKVIITTRKPIKDLEESIFEIPFVGLNKDDAINYIRHLAVVDSSIQTATDSAFAPILELTEGNPLLIKLVINRFLVKRLPLDYILNEIKSDKREGISVVDYIYYKSLEELQQMFSEMTAHQLMSAFCDSLAGTVHDYDELLEFSMINDSTLFDKILQHACKLALIRFSGLNAKYSVHSLLWHYLCWQP